MYVTQGEGPYCSHACYATLMNNLLGTRHDLEWARKVLPEACHIMHIQAGLLILGYGLIEVEVAPVLRDRSGVLHDLRIPYADISGIGLCRIRLGGGHHHMLYMDERGYFDPRTGRVSQSCDGAVSHYYVGVICCQK